MVIVHSFKIVISKLNSGVSILMDCSANLTEKVCCENHLC